MLWTKIISFLIGFSTIILVWVSFMLAASYETPYVEEYYKGFFCELNKETGQGSKSN